MGYQLRSYWMRKPRPESDPLRVSELAGDGTDASRTQLWLLSPATFLGFSSTVSSLFCEAKIEASQPAQTRNNVVFTVLVNFLSLKKKKSGQRVPWPSSRCF